MSKNSLKKKLSVLLLGSFILVNTTVPAMAEPGTKDNEPAIKISLNGKVLSSTVDPIIENNTTMVPVRVIAEGIGAKVSWDAASNKVSVQCADNKVLNMVIDQKYAAINSNAEQREASLTTAPVIKNGNTLVPLRFIAEEMGLQVKWNEAEHTVYLNNSADKDVHSQSGIEDYQVPVNENKEAEIAFLSSKVIKAPQIKVLSKDDQVFKGESKVKDSSLGDYRVELIFTDIRLTAELQKKLGLETKKIEGNNLLQSMRVAYPADDSAMVIYLGCKASPRTDLFTNENGVFVTLINEDIQQGLSVKSKDVVSQNETMQIDLSIPQVEGLKDKKIQDSINSKFNNQAMQFKDQTFEGLDEYVKDAKKEGWDVHPYVASSNYRVTWSKNDILSLYVDYYQYTGGAHGNTDRQYAVIDLKKGKELSIKDLFKAGADYKTVINKEINKQIKANPDKYFEETIKDWKGINDDQSFYVEDGDLICYFNHYEIAPYCSGICNFTIPLTQFGDGVKADF